MEKSFIRPFLDEGPVSKFFRLNAELREAREQVALHQKQQKEASHSQLIIPSKIIEAQTAEEGHGKEAEILHERAMRLLQQAEEQRKLSVVHRQNREDLLDKLLILRQTEKHEVDLIRAAEKQLEQVNAELEFFRKKVRRIIRVATSNGKILCRQMRSGLKIQVFYLAEPRTWDDIIELAIWIGAKPLPSGMLIEAGIAAQKRLYPLARQIINIPGPKQLVVRVTGPDHKIQTEEIAFGMIQKPGLILLQPGPTTA